MSGALRPSFFPELKSLEKSAQLQEVTTEELALYGMAQTTGWLVLKDIATNAMKELEEVNRIAIANGMPVEDIGRNAIVISLVQGIVEKLLNKVADATEACERANSQ